MIENSPIRVEIEKEEDGRFLASVPDLPGVMAYGNLEEEAVRKVKSIALQVLADMIESGEEIPEPLKVLFVVLRYHREAPSRLVTCEAALSIEELSGAKGVSQGCAALAVPTHDANNSKQIA
jgi:predicted RNase H-like HicB family nuclease